MDKPILQYVSVEDRPHTSAAEQHLIQGLVKDGFDLKPESEILCFSREAYPQGPHMLSCLISPVNELGVIKYPPSWYNSRDSEPTPSEHFYDRNRELYLQSRKIDFFPIAQPGEGQEGTAHPRAPFPSEAQKAPFEKLFQLYMGANPDPYPRLAIVNCTHTVQERGLETFVEIAGKFAQLQEVPFPTTVTKIFLRE